MKKLILLLCITCFLSSCFKDSEKAQFSALGKQHIITLYGCDGKQVKQWTSTGSVSNEEKSDVWFFEDLETGKLIEVTGNIVIEVK